MVQDALSYPRDRVSVAIPHTQGFGTTLTSVLIKYLTYEMTFLIPMRWGLHIQSSLSLGSSSGARSVRKMGKGCLTSVFSNEMVLTVGLAGHYQ